MHILILLLILTSPVSALEQHICDEIAVVLQESVEDGSLTELEAQEIHLRCLNND